MIILSLPIYGRKPFAENNKKQCLHKDLSTRDQFTLRLSERQLLIILITATILSLIPCLINVKMLGLREIRFLFLKASTNEFKLSVCIVSNQLLSQRASHVLCLYFSHKENKTARSLAVQMAKIVVLFLLLFMQGKFSVL